MIGTFNLFGPGPIGFADADLVLVRAPADVATIIILQQRISAAAPTPTG